MQRVHCLVLVTEGYSVAEIEKKTCVSERSQRAIRKKSTIMVLGQKRTPEFLNHIIIIDGVKSGRPKEILKDKEEALLAAIRSDRSDREKSSEVLAYEQNISQSAALRILKSNELTNVKPIIKPDLTAAMRKIRFKWALAHQHWTLEDWKNVIWSDKTSIILNHR
jgi:hypothetical protein